MGRVEQPTADGLTDQQIQFIDKYIECNMNATKAAIAAGYAEGSAHVQGHRLLRNDKIRAELAARLKAQHMTADELLHHVSLDARGIFGEYILPGEDGKLDLEAMERDNVLHLIDQIVPSKYGTSYKGPSRQTAQAMLIKILGLQRTQHTVSGEVKITGSLDDRFDQLLDLIRGSGAGEAQSHQDRA